jgi:hypothetical protein
MPSPRRLKSGDRGVHFTGYLSLQAMDEESRHQASDALLLPNSQERLLA